MNRLTLSIRRSIRNWGADLVGVGDVSQGAENDALGKELKHFTRVISIAVHLHPLDGSQVVDSQAQINRQMIGYISKNEDIVHKINDIMKKAARAEKRRRKEAAAGKPRQGSLAFGNGNGNGNGGKSAGTTARERAIRDWMK